MDGRQRQPGDGADARSPDRALFHVYVEGGGWFRVQPAEAVITALADGHPVRREERLWGLPAQLALLARGDRPLQAAAGRRPPPP